MRGKSVTVVTKKYAVIKVSEKNIHISIKWDQMKFRISLELVNEMLLWCDFTFFCLLWGRRRAAKGHIFLERGAWFWSVCWLRVYLFLSMYVLCWFICTSITIVLVWWPKEHTSVSLLLFFRSYTKRDMLLSCEKCSRLPLPRVTFKRNLKKRHFWDKSVWAVIIAVVVSSTPTPTAIVVTNRAHQYGCTPNRWMCVYLHTLTTATTIEQ